MAVLVSARTTASPLCSADVGLEVTGEEEQCWTRFVDSGTTSEWAVIASGSISGLKMISAQDYK